MIEVVLKAFEQPDEAREFDKGRFDLVRLGGMTVGRARYEPGWRWSLHVGPHAGTSLCEVEHVPHDSWVIGDEPYVSLHFGGAAAYAR